MKQSSGTDLEWVVSEVPSQVTRDITFPPPPVRARISFNSYKSSTRPSTCRRISAISIHFTASCSRPRGDEKNATHFHLERRDLLDEFPDTLPRRPLDVDIGELVSSRALHWHLTQHICAGGNETRWTCDQSCRSWVDISDRSSRSSLSFCANSDNNFTGIWKTKTRLRRLEMRTRILRSPHVHIHVAVGHCQFGEL